MALVQSQLSLHEIEGVFPLITPLLRDEGVTEIMVVSGADGVKVFYEKSGGLKPHDVGGVSFRDLEAFCYAVARPLRLDPSQTPLMDARLADGSRVALCVSPATPFPAMTIRRFGKRRFTAENLVAGGALPQHVLDQLIRALKGDGNVLVAGGTGSGKTTLLNALIQQFPADDRILVVEDTIELDVTQPNTVRLEARDLESYYLTARDMVKHALRHRPDHIVIGEIRGDEAQDVLQALNTGHGGSLTTIHANTARDALTRVACCAKQAADDYPWDIICQLVAMAFNLVVHQRRLPGGKRGVSELLAVHSYDRVKAQFVTESLWKREVSEEHAEADAPRPPAVAAGIPVGSGAEAAATNGPGAPALAAQPAVPVSGSVPGPAVSAAPSVNGDGTAGPASAVAARLNGSPAQPPAAAPAAAAAAKVRPGPRLVAVHVPEPKPMMVRGWARRRVQRLSDVPQASGVAPAGQPVRFVVRRPQWTVPRDFVLEQKPSASPAPLPVEEDRGETRAR